MYKFISLGLALALLLVLRTVPAFSAYGISIDGTLKYPKDFVRFDYTSPEAKKGGGIVLHGIGSFDKMNPFTLKGTDPLLLDQLIFEPLAQSSLDEPLAKYGLIAKDIEVAPDKLSVVFTINENARFSDNTPVTAEDVAFSLATLKSDQVYPLYAYYYHDITGSEILGRLKIRLKFAKVNRELPMIASELPVMSKDFYTKHPFGAQNSMVPPIGSGPYVVDSVNPGKSITYKRNPHYWARDLPVRNGMYNFDTIKVDYYKDPVVAVEAFKAGDFDFMMVNIAKQWARDLTGEEFDKGRIIKKIFPNENNEGMQGFVMNSRRKLFQDRRVREALGLALDFEWTNKSLFFDQYTRSSSYFNNSYLAATGLPAGKELQYLETFRKELPPEVFTSPLSPPDTNGPGALRGNLQKAQKLLAEAGWTIKDGVLQDGEGNPFRFEILLVSSEFERVLAPFASNLKKIGITADYRTIDPALYTERMQKFDFDMTVHVFGQSLSPGNEQRNYWHSEAAMANGSQNLAGVSLPVVDYLVDRIIYAENKDDLVAACKALDRVLWYQYYVIPNWYMSGYRLAYYNKFSQPSNLPKFYNYFQLLMTWWLKQ
ncbi:MAG: extracellular solute-binding protein [Desulfocapsaceae bacterium]|nr:extracellular solute-binding protein [Desulfocapsaceae bacterium]